MTTQPTPQSLSRTTRLLAAIVIALVALGITWMADRWLGHEGNLKVPPPTDQSRQT